MGYEIAGGIGVKMALPDREVIVVVGDGSYLMMNSEIATSVMLGCKLIVVVNDNRGFGCINRLQKATGGEPFNNLLRDARHEVLPEIDFVAHARALGAQAVKVDSIAELERAFDARARGDFDPGHRHRDRPHRLHRRRRRLVGRRRARDVRARRGRLRRAKITRRRWRPSAWETEMTIRIGANPIGWSNDDLQEIGGDTPLEACLAEARQAGVEGMEKGHKLPSDGAALKAKLAEFGLVFVGGWYSTELLRRSAREEFESAKAHIAMTKGAGADVMIAAECSNTIHGDRAAAAVEAPEASRRRLDGVRRADDRVRRAASPTKV